MRHSFAGLRRNPYSVLLLTALAVCLCLFSIKEIRLYSRFADLQYSASQIEKGRPVELTALERLIGDTYKLDIENVCHSTFVKSFLTVLLASLDTSDQKLDYEKWFEALSRTEKFLRHALICLPTDGNLWARYAMVRQASAEQPEEIHRLISLSQRYSPAEENAIIARYFLYNRLTDASLVEVSAELGKDLEILCLPSSGTLRGTIRPPKPRLLKMMAQLAPSCPVLFTVKT